MQTFRPFAWLCALGLLAALSPGAAAQVSSQAPLFVPDDHVPLSEFSDNVFNGEIVLQVKSEVLVWALAQPEPLKVARCLSIGCGIYFDPSECDEETGLVTLQTTVPGTYVVVSDALRNTLPVVTHWDELMNQGRGGYVQGATDGISLIDWDEATGTFIGADDPDVVDSDEPGWGDSFGTYALATDKFALFSDGSELLGYPQLANISCPSPVPCADITAPPSDPNPWLRVAPLRTGVVPEATCAPEELLGGEDKARTGGVSSDFLFDILP